MYERGREKMKKMNRFLSGVVVLCTAVMLMTGCSGGREKQSTVAENDVNVTEPGELPIVKEKITLTVGVPGTSKVEDFETNAFTKYLEEKTNIDLDFYQFPSSGGMEKLNVMLASNTELPDVIVGFNIPKTTFLAYASDGVFLELSDYYEKYGYWYKQLKEKTQVKNLDGYMSIADGGKYFFPNIAEQLGNMYGGKAFINKAWLDKLGLAMPETIEDFRNVMKAFIAQDPNGNGKNDEIGFTGSKGGWNEKPVNFLMNSFVYDDYKDGFVVEDGKVSLNYTTDAYKKGLGYLKEMAAEKTLDIQAYTQDNNTLRSLISSKVVGAFASGSPDNLFLDDPSFMNEYVALPPLKGPDGVAYTLKSEPSPSCGGVITKYCKHPEAAFRFLDFFLSEEASVFARYGMEGVDWKPATKDMKAMFGDYGFEAKIQQILPYGSIQNSHWNQAGPSFRSSDISDTLAWDGNPTDGEYFKAVALKAYIDKGPKEIFNTNKMLLPLEEMTEYNDLYTSISGCVKENIPNFITGEKNLEGDWDVFQRSLKNLGVDRYIELAQEGYEKFNSMDDK